MLDALLDRLAERGPIEQLWFVGDLVNRGPDSLNVVRRVRALGDQAITVLGNHDLSLLALAGRADAAQQAPAELQRFLAAEDSPDLLDWLRQRPVMHRDVQLGWTMVHAGLPPEWSVAEALSHARELENALRRPDYGSFLQALYGNTPDQWSADLAGLERLRFIANALTRLRFVSPEGRLDMTYKKTLAAAPEELVPWFRAPERASADSRIVFGHWSALEHVVWPDHNVWGIDTGAAWGGPLTALDLTTEPPELIQVPAEPA